MLSLELALSLPLVALAVLLVFHAMTYARDALLVQEAARAGARAAATSTSPRAVEQAARDAASPAHVTVAVSPPHRRAGDLAVVEVSMVSRAGLGKHTVHGRAVAQVEPGVG